MWVFNRPQLLVVNTYGKQLSTLTKGHYQIMTTLSVVRFCCLTIDSAHGARGEPNAKESKSGRRKIVRQDEGVSREDNHFLC